MNKLSDFELNALIAEKLGLKISKTYPDGSHNSDGIYIDRDKLINGCYLVDYCNNWNDLMSLIEELNLGIKLEIGADRCYAYIYFSNYELSAYAKTRKRALAECLLKVLESNNG